MPNKPTLAQQVKWYKGLVEYNHIKIKNLKIRFENKLEQEKENKFFNVETDFYMVEYPKGFEIFTIFKKLEDAVQTIKIKKEGYKWSDFKILSLLKGEKGLEVVQISWADILEVIA